MFLTTKFPLHSSPLIPNVLHLRNQLMLNLKLVLFSSLLLLNITNMSILSSELSYRQNFCSRRNIMVTNYLTEICHHRKYSMYKLLKIQNRRTSLSKFYKLFSLLLIVLINLKLVHSLSSLVSCCDKHHDQRKLEKGKGLFPRAVAETKEESCLLTY